MSNAEEHFNHIRFKQEYGDVYWCPRTRKYKFKAQRNDMQEDMVNSPPHYNKHGVECIDAIKASMTDEEYQGYLKGNALKYMWRYKYKGNPKQDLEKAQWYLSRLVLSLDLLDSAETTKT